MHGRASYVVNKALGLRPPSRTQIGSSGRTRTYNPSVNSRILVTLQTQGLQALVARPSCVLSALRQEGRQQTRGGANEQKGYSGTTDVQNAHRFAAIGIALRHSGHFFVVGSGGVSPRRSLAMTAF